ncbi:transcriptional regulator, RpiR family [Beutenbergia cavernae DSM 12333]|uniref:Transcriptional regulator, RpiR family n=1 Tax=Beutenbergia cavernae (strain ATCC BAA-8 / DSM 12333 / CCUG 43141 / JCM 11478 / NBRC 16432 / NCIMB 13614 / HKI 0122) TaxID=471853 RepID=C5C2G7_BEUC1|nr:MurR/RpiR family transcriptional regulator [Beutenbergia cavernae]ACQ79653.1 transcriptional regulator, RpiR family [Beutenbergia cavernae DSM 12333]
MSIQSSIQSRLDQFAPSMRRVAEAILERPQVVLEKTISELASQCETSETTIVRFCRTLGLTGYVQLRLELATEIGRENAQRGELGDHGADILAEDGLAAMAAKIAFTDTLGIEETLASLDIEHLERVVDAIDTAGRSVTYGVGSSGSSAADLQRKLFRIGRVAFTFDDPHDAVTAAALSSPGDVAVAFSHSGATREALAFLATAGKHGARTVAVTNSAESALARAADIVLVTSVRETQFRSGAMASRIAQLMIVDCIFVGVAQRRYDQTVDALKSTYAAAQELRS